MPQPLRLNGCQVLRHVDSPLNISSPAFANYGCLKNSCSSGFSRWCCGAVGKFGQAGKFQQTRPFQACNVPEAWKLPTASLNLSYCVLCVSSPQSSMPCLTLCQLFYLVLSFEPGQSQELASSDHAHFGCTDSAIWGPVCLQVL